MLFLLFVFVFLIYDPFLWIGFNCLKRAESAQKGSLLLTIKVLAASDNHLINHGSTKD